MGLADADGGGFGKEAALGLIGGFGHGINAICEMDQRHILKPLGLPFRGFVEGIMQLEIAPPMAEGLRRCLVGRACLAFQ